MTEGRPEDKSAWKSLADLEDKLRKRLEHRHVGEIINIALVMTANGGIELRGQVASEAARSDAIRQLASFHNVPRIIDRLEVTGYFKPATDDEWFFPKGRETGPAVGGDRNINPDGGGVDGGSVGESSGMGGVGSGPPSDHDRRADDLRRGDFGSGDVDDGLAYSHDEEANDQGVSERVQKQSSSPGAINRHPFIGTEDPLMPGRTVRILVDLTVVAQDPMAPSIEIARLEPGWGELAVEATIVGPVLTEVDPSRAIVWVREDGSSEAAVFSATLSNEIGEGDEVRIRALFNHDGRFCGSWETAVGSAVSAPKAKDSPTGHSATSVTIAPEAAPPDLQVTIIETASGELIWSWTVRPGVATGLGPGPSWGRINIGTDAARYAAELLGACPTMSAADFRRRMRAVGEQIWKVAPGEFRDTYLWLRNSIGGTFPIQFIVNEFHVPWEMMRPDSPDDADHLFLTHPVARWPLDVGNRLLQPLPKGTVQSFVPDYPANATLPAARDEAQWLVTNLAAVTPKPSKNEFLSLLECHSASNAVWLLHFAGHGRASSGYRDAGIRLMDDWVVIDDVNTGGTKLGNRDRSMVVLNACETATSGSQLGWVEGWAPMLASRGFGAVVAPLWRVQDEVAFNVVTGGLKNLVMDGCTLGEAFTKARASASDRSIAAFAFMTYGDVMARAPAS